MKTGSRDRSVEVRIEALRAAIGVTSPVDNVRRLLANSRALCQFLETGKVPDEVETD